MMWKRLKDLKNYMLRVKWRIASRRCLFSAFDDLGAGVLGPTRQSLIQRGGVEGF